MSWTFDTNAMVAQLTPEEGLRLHVYDDATGQPIVAGYTVKGNPTIGIGRNLAGYGITKEEAQYLCVNNITICEDQLDNALPWWRDLSPLRQMQMVDLCFNMGIDVLLQFHEFLGAMQAGQWQAAVEDLKASLWWTQVGERGPAIADRILKG